MEENAGGLIKKFQDDGPRLFGDDTYKEIMRIYGDSNDAVRQRWFSHRSTLFDTSL